MAENTVATNANEHDVAVETANQEQTREPERYVAPAVDIFEKDDALIVVADVPGLDREQIDISVDNDILTIKGTVRESVEREYVFREFRSTNFYRQFRLGNRIDRGKINAELRHGVLRLTLPFAEEAKPRQIDIKVS